MDKDLRAKIHRAMLTKSGSAIEYADLTVIPLGHAVTIALEFLKQHEQQAIVAELKSLLGRGDNALTDRIKDLTKEQPHE